MEPIPAPNPAPAPIPDPSIPAPAPIPAPIPAPAPTRSGFKDFLSGVTLVEVLAATMFFGALALSIVYYRNKIKYMKSDQQALIDKVEDLSSEVEELKAPFQQQQ
jgi:hypothetical protein